jgi:hypothetical protein
MLKGVKLLQEAGNEKPISLKEARELRKLKEGADAEKESSEVTGAGKASSAAGQERDSQ